VRLAENRIANVAAWLASLCLIAAATVCAYFRIFGQFATYDDEGYILQSVRSYLQGGRLFDEVFTQYGPAFFVLESLVHRTLGAPLTHDFERFVTIGIWVASSAGGAAVALRLTRSLMVAAWTFVGVLLQLAPIINEPAHPQGPLVLVLTTVVLLSTGIRPGTWPSGRIAIVGALTAFALLTKVNVGAFIALGFGLPLLLSANLPRTRLSAIALSTAVLAACALPLLVTKNHVMGWAFAYGVTISLSLAATTAVIFATRRGELPFALPFLYASATAVATSLLLMPVLMHGTSVSALWTGVIVRPSQFADVFQMPLVLPATNIAAAGAALALALGYAALTQRGKQPGPLVIAAVKLAAAGIGLYSMRAGFGQMIANIAPVVWIMLLPSDANDGDERALGRRVLATSAVLQALQAYPVAGSQLGFATFLMLPVIFTTGYDALRTLARWPRGARVLLLAPQLVFVIVGLWLYRPILSVAPWRNTYDVSFALRLPGATHLRMPASHVADFQWLSANLAGRCDILLTLPGLYSFNAWSHLDPPSASNVTAWMTLLTEAEQAAIWKGVDASRHPCAVYNPALAANWAGPRLESLPALRELQTRFAARAEAGGYQLLEGRQMATPAPFTWLFMGRQTFARGDTPLPVVASFLQQPQTSTIRLWLRTKYAGVALGCQSEEHVWVPSKRWVPMIYVGNGGRLYGQHWTATFDVQSTQQPVNDGAWHHVALIREGDAQRLYVDGQAAGSQGTGIESEGLASCQAGAGVTVDWPDILRRSNFRGDIEGLVVSGRAWSAPEVEADRRTTVPRD
jgi:hypothetical protein